MGMETIRLISTYHEFERYEHHNHTRRCIDGTITGSNKCIAYCKYEKHPGFLTKRQCRDHDCVAKKCAYYVEKESRSLSAWQIQLQECARLIG